MNRIHLDLRTTAELGRDEPLHPQWIDRLVELQVLAEHGDSAAAAAAAIWIAEDPQARRVWEDVERTCDQVRNGSDRAK
jgi:hypothetical protein